MPELLQIKNMGTSGINTDQQPWELPPEFITRGENYRVFAGSLISAGGYKTWSNAPADFEAAHLIHVPTSNGNFWLVMGRSAVYVFDGGNWTEVSSLEGYAGLSINDELRWSSSLLGRIPVINNPQAQPEYWSPQSAGQILQPLPFSPGVTWNDKSYSARTFRSHKNFLFALNLIEGISEQEDSYRWSHPSDINGLPFTWDETDQSALAGKASLGGDGGAIIDGQSLRDAFCIYSEDSIDILDFTGDEFVWRRRELSATVGLLARNCVAEVKGVHFLLTDGDIVRNDGNTIDSIAHNRIRRTLSSRIGSNYSRSYVVRQDNKKEVWFCIPEEGEDYPNIAYIYNWKDNSWAIRDIEQKVAHSAYGSQALPLKRWDDIIDADAWDTTLLTWASEVVSPLNFTIIGADPTVSTLFILDTANASEVDINTVIERTDFPLIDTRSVTTIVRVYPHIESTTDLFIEFGSQDYPSSPVRWKTGVVFSPQKDRKIDVRTTGELHAWRISTIGKGHFRLSGMNIEFEVSGVR